MPNVGITDQREGATIPEQKKTCTKEVETLINMDIKQVSKLRRLRCETGIS
jgi:hypothetical protein